MTRRTFVESIVVRGHTTDAIATEISGVAVAHVPIVPVDTCQFSESCAEHPTFVVGQWDDETQNEDETTLRYMCFDHALQVQQMLEENGD